MDCSPPGPSIHGISQARILEWVAISFSRWSSRPGDRTHIFCIGRQILYRWATKEAHPSLAHNQCSKNGTDDDDGGGGDDNDGDDGGDNGDDDGDDNDSSDDYKSNAENYSENGDALQEDEEKQVRKQLNITLNEQGGNYSVSGGIKWHEINQDILDMGTIERL